MGHFQVSIFPCLFRTCVQSVGFPPGKGHPGSRPSIGVFGMLKRRFAGCSPSGSMDHTKSPLQPAQRPPRAELLPGKTKPTTFPQVPPHKLKLGGVMAKARWILFSLSSLLLRGLGWVQQWNPPEQLVLLPPQLWCRSPVPLSPRPGEDTPNAGVLLSLPQTHNGASSAQGTVGQGIRGAPRPRAGTPRGGGGPGPAPGAGRLRPGALPAARGCRAPSPGAA